MSLRIRMEKLKTAKDHLDFFGIPYHRNLIEVTEGRVLKLFKQRCNEINKYLINSSDEDKFMIYFQSLASCYLEFIYEKNLN